MKVEINGTNYEVKKVHVEHIDSRSIATGLVCGKEIAIEYDGLITSECDTADGKPWLRRVRHDLAAKYAETTRSSRATADDVIVKARGLYADGWKVKDISREVGISVPTVYKYVEATRRKSLPTILVDEDFFRRLTSLGFTVDSTNVFIPNCPTINLAGMTQIDALALIKAEKAKATKRERKLIDRLFTEIVA